MSFKTNDTKSLQQHITNIIQGSLRYGDGKAITNTSVITSVLIVIFIIGISLLYSTSSPTKNRRLTSAIFLGIGGTLLFCFVSMSAIAHRPKTMNQIQWIINLFVLLMFAYFYAVYCLFPLIIYVGQNQDIYGNNSTNQGDVGGHDVDGDRDGDDNRHDPDESNRSNDYVEKQHQYTNVTNIITLVTNILIISVMIYIIYLLLWRQNTPLLKRQLLPIAVVFGVAAGKSVKEIINHTS